MQLLIASVLLGFLAFSSAHACVNADEIAKCSVFSGGLGKAMCQDTSGNKLGSLGEIARCYYVSGDFDNFKKLVNWIGSDKVYARKLFEALEKIHKDKSLYRSRFVDYLTDHATIGDTDTLVAAFRAITAAGYHRNTEWKGKLKALSKVLKKATAEGVDLSDITPFGNGFSTDNREYLVDAAVFSKVDTENRQSNLINQTLLIWILGKPELFQYCCKGRPIMELFSMLNTLGRADFFRLMGKVPRNEKLSRKLADELGAEYFLSAPPAVITSIARHTPYLLKRTYKVRNTLVRLNGCGLGMIALFHPKAQPESVKTLLSAIPELALKSQRRCIVSFRNRVADQNYKTLMAKLHIRNPRRFNQLTFSPREVARTIWQTLKLDMGYLPSQRLLNMFNLKTIRVVANFNVDSKQKTMEASKKE